MKKFISALVTLLMLASAALAQNRLLQQPAPLTPGLLYRGLNPGSK